MFYQILTDLVIFLHLLFIIFVVAGGFLTMNQTWVALLHLPAVIWGSYIELSGSICPLTPLEIQFRLMAGELGYSRGFIDHYFTPVIYPAGLSREVQVFLGVVVVTVNLGIYASVLYRHFRPAQAKNKS